MRVARPEAASYSQSGIGRVVIIAQGCRAGVTVSAADRRPDLRTPPIIEMTGSKPRQMPREHNIGGVLGRRKWERVCLVLGAWCLVLGAWRLALGAQRLAGRRPSASAEAASR